MIPGSRQHLTDREEVLEPLRDPSLRDPQSTAGDAEHGGGDRAALRFGLERCELLLRCVEGALVGERDDEDGAVQDAVEGRRGQLGRCERTPAVGLGGGQIAAAKRQPAPVGEADGEPAAVPTCARVRDRDVEQRLQLSVPLGPEQRQGRLGEPGCEREPRRNPEPGGRSAGAECSGGEVGSDLRGLVREDRDHRGRRQQLGWSRLIGSSREKILAAGRDRGCRGGVVQRGDDRGGFERKREV